MKGQPIGDGFTSHGFDLCGTVSVTACCTSKTGRKWAVVRVRTADGHAYDIFASKRKHYIERITDDNRKVAMVMKKGGK